MELRPPIERVPSRRGVPLAVGLAALALLGLFVARPWEDRSPRPSPVALSTPAAAIPGTSPGEESPAGPSASPAPTATLRPTTTPPPLPTPDLGPLDPPGHYTLSVDPNAALARCTYGRSRGGRRAMVGIEVLPPTVTVDERAAVIDISRVGWRFELEMNRQERVFDREWETVATSRMQVTATAERAPAPFTPLTLGHRARDLPATSVFRARLVIEWYTRNLELAGRAEIVANRYEEVGGAPRGVWPPYCAGVLAAR